jgi:hypothetical protein
MFFFTHMGRVVAILMLACNLPLPWWMARSYSGAAA